MKPIAILIPGFNTKGLYMAELEPYLVKAGYDTKLFLYKKPSPFTLFNIVANRFRTKRILGQLVNVIYKEKGREIILVGHSNGVMLAWAAMNLCQFVSGVVAFNGALNRDTMFKNWCINCYCSTDNVLKIGGRFRPFSKWGDYGARKQAHVGADDLKLDSYGVKGHSDFINHLPSIMAEVLTRIKGQTEDEAVTQVV